MSRKLATHGRIQREAKSVTAFLSRTGLSLMLVAMIGMTSGHTASDSSGDVGDRSAPATNYRAFSGGLSVLASTKQRRFTNGCRHSRRGISSCATLVGGAYGSNSSPRVWERQIGRHLGVRRTYYAAYEVNKAVRTARQDLAKRRMPWISFKPPRSWEAMADGAGDHWARELTKRLAKLDGPVWLAIHHEPEGDGDILYWKRMQKRLARIVRPNAPNVAYSIILTGWNQLYGPKQLSLGRIWPNTKIDLVGFDVYDFYGARRGGELVTKHRSLRKHYFHRLSRWASRKEIAWGLAESGHTNSHARAHPNWPSRVYRDLRVEGAIAFSYFNTPVNSSQTWPLNINVKRVQFGKIVRRSPSL